MSTIGSRVVVVGELHADEDIVIEGRVEGSIVCEQASVVIATTGEMRGDVIARDITVQGRVAGRLIARGFVDLTPDAKVTGPVMAPRFVLADGALYSGRVEPQHVEAAIRVARFEQKKREGTAPAPAAGSHGQGAGT